LTAKSARHVPAFYLATLVLLLLPVMSLAQSGQQRGADWRERFRKFPVTTPAPGDRAPDFTLKTLKGRDFSLSRAYERNPVVIEFGSFT
jgi:hypothetical protein